MSILLGNTARIIIEMVDNSSASGMRMRVRLRGSATETEVPLTITGDTATGDYTPTVAGVYEYRAWRTGNPAFAKEGEFIISGTTFAQPDP